MSIGVRQGLPLTRPGAGVLGAGRLQPGTMESAAAQGRALLNPDPVTSKTAVDPMQKHAYDAASGFESGIAKGTNEEIQRELGRARDEISVGMQSEGEAAGARGADQGFFRSRALAAGARNMGDLQARLAGVALDKHQAAIDSMTNAAGGAAGTRNALALGTMAQRTADQRVSLDEADLQNRINQQPYDRLMQMMGLINGVGGSGGLFNFGTSAGGAGGAGGVGGAGYAGSAGGSVPMGAYAALGPISSDPFLFGGPQGGSTSSGPFMSPPSIRRPGLF